MTIRDSLRSLYSFLRRYIHAPRMEISRANVLGAVALLVISIIALMIRLLPTIGFQLLVRAFDPWFNLRETQYIIENGFAAWFGWYDTTTWVPFGRNIPESAYPGIPFTTALIYLAFQAVGVPVDLITVAVLFPAFMGVMGVLAIYALGVEVSSKEVGLLAAFFMAVIPAYTQRTIAGFFDNEAIGIVAILLILFFFARALRKGSIASAILGGLSLGYLSASWSVYLYMFQILAIFALIMVLIRRYSRRLLLAYSGVVITGMAIAICVPRIGPDWPTSTTGLIPLGVFGILLLIELSRTYRLTELQFPSSFGALSNRLRPYFAYIFGAMCAFIVVGLGYLFQSGLFLSVATAQRGTGFLGDIAGKFYTVIDPLIRQNAFLLASVGEHLPAPWATFWFNLSLLVLLLPFGFYIAFRREREVDILLIIFALTALYFSGSMIRLALLLAPAAAILGAYGLLMAIRPFRPIFWQRPIMTRRRRRITPPTSRSFATVAYLFVIILLLSATITSIDMTNQMGSPEIIPASRDSRTGEILWGPAQDYLEAFSWMRHHTPPGSTMVSWWDYGYWTRQVGERRTVVDNATINKTQIAWVGRMFMETDPVEALRICRRWNVDYVFVHFGLGQPGLSGDEGKWQWMIRIAGEVFGDQVPSEDYFWNDTTGQYKAPYFQTMIYNMLWLNSSEVGVADNRPVDEATEQPGQLPSQATEPGITIFSLFEPVYFSQIQMMKIYKCNYTWLDSGIEIGGASIYPHYNDTNLIEHFSSITLEVRNTGSYTVEVDSVGIEYWDWSAGEYRSDDIPQLFLTTNTGSLRIEPGENIILNAGANNYFTVGTDMNVTVNLVGYTPDLNASVTVPVRNPPAYNLTALATKSYAYDNGTIYVELENMGAGYLTVDKQGLVDDETFLLSDAILTGGRVLFAGEKLGVTINATALDLDLVAGEDVTVLFHYMSLMPTYAGLNVSITLPIQAAPSPPTPSGTSHQDQNTEETSLIIESTRCPLDYDPSLLFFVVFFESSSFFITRRYEP
ncbi:MAG: STT3 domain-containing protein [Promethearchaeota archaeon]